MFGDISLRDVSVGAGAGLGALTVGTGTVGAVEKLQNRPGVRYVEENGTVQISASDNEDSVDSLDVTYSIDSGSSRSTAITHWRPGRRTPRAPPVRRRSR